jgi:hypothetical protein
MSQDSFLTLSAGFLLGVLMTLVAGGAYIQVRLVAERERAERIQEEADKERDRADDLENQVRGYRLEAELAAQDRPRPTVRVEVDKKAEEDKQQAEEERKRAYKEFWEAVEQERKKKQASTVQPGSPGKNEPRP